MQNIDPLYFLTPVISIGFSFGLVAYLWARKRFTWWVLLTSLAAYAGAIALKVAVQALTYQGFRSAVGGDPVALGAYFGLQTAVFEVGGAFVVARYATARMKLGGKDAAGFGAGLAMWENGVLVGGELLLVYAVYYLTLGAGGSAAAQLLGDLTQSSPALFYQAGAALPLIGYAVLERVSSLLAHLSWGYLVVMAAYSRRNRYFLLALPMGMVDFFVPLSGDMGLGRSEALFFALSATCLLVAYAATRGAIMTGAGAPRDANAMDTASLIRTTIRRSISFGKVYLGIGIVLPLVEILPLVAATSSAGPQAPAFVGELPALILPMFAILGSIGGLLVFTSDRNKGVYEYLIAYGVDTSTIFWSTIAATVCLVLIPLSFGVAEAAVALALSGGLSAAFVELLVVYTIPLSLAAAAFMCTAGMIWSALTTQMPGVNSPVGIAPLLGIAPVLLVFFLGLSLGGGTFVFVAGGSSLLLTAASAGLVYLGTRKMVRERFLSNA